MSGQRIRIVVIERDIYARQAITSYLSWDRRTRVVAAFSAPHELRAALKADPAMGRLDAIMLDTNLASNP
jgi:DNA-binding NarL/FixJ family response regulator